MSRPGKVGALALAFSVTVGCRVPQSDKARTETPLEIEDVAPPVDAELTLEGDVKGPRMVEGISGVLPTDYPPDLPTYEPSSIVDFGRNGRRSWVEFDTAASSAAVAAELRRRLSRRGWSLDAGGREWSAELDGRQVRFRIEELHPGTRIRVEY